jgi:phage terminase small subunit
MPRNALATNPADTPAWAAELNNRERRFVEEYLVDLSAKQAAIRAGLGKTPKSASEIASRMRRKQSVAAAISALLAERGGATGSRIIEELGKLAFADVTDIVKVKDGRVIVTDTDQLSPDQRASIAEISETVGGGGRTVKVRMHDKISALDRLARCLSLYKERVEVSGPHGEPVQIEDSKALLASLIAGMAVRLNETAVVEIDPPVRRIASPMAQPVRIIDAE